MVGALNRKLKGIGFGDVLDAYAWVTIDVHKAKEIRARWRRETVDC